MPSAPQLAIANNGTAISRWRSVTKAIAVAETKVTVKSISEAAARLGLARAIASQGQHEEAERRPAP